MAMATKGGDRAVPYINVTPLIDVLLVLLIIFMVVTPLKPSRFKADIPTQRDPNEDLSKLKPNPLTLVVTIGQDLQLKLNQDSMGSVNDPSALAAKLQQTFHTPTKLGWKPHRTFLKINALKKPCS
jgi:biopolymer transport protein TolR